MALTPGTRLGPYEVTAQIGVGGMGEVYKATDTKLKRSVAIKILPPDVAADADRLARFQREAEVLASLNHPNIAHIHGLEENGGVTALVMELVEGEDLSQRIAHGPIPIDEALPIAKQIAEALEAAHEQGIIHRDLKPANIKVRADGTVKVLDFGLAKAMEPTSTLRASAGQALSMSPTVTSPALVTGVGMILGTAAYMSPEQARGKIVDKRSDIWALGSVLYEMLTGRRAFEGEDVAQTLAYVISREPDLNLLPANVPVAIRVLLRRCLEKDPRKRLADIAAATVLIDEAPMLGSSTAVDTNRSNVGADVRRLWWRRMASSVPAVAVTSVLVGATVWWALRPPPANVIRTEITTSGANALIVNGLDRNLAITPDGSRVVYQANGQLVVRALNELEPRTIGGVGAARGLFMSPDGQWIGYFDPVSIKRVPIAGGTPISVTPIDGNPRGAAWASDGTIVYATSPVGGGLWRVPAAGGNPVLLTTPDAKRGEADHLWPEFLPDGRNVLFTITAADGDVDKAQIAVADVQSRTYRVLLRGGSHAHYVPTGHLIYGANGRVRAVPFDLGRLEVTGTPAPVLEGVTTSSAGVIDLMVSSNGTLVYVPGTNGTGSLRSLVWVDRDGREEPIPAPARPYIFPRLSPDDTRIALDIGEQNRDIWVWDIKRETLTRLTSDPLVDRGPTWTPDGRRVIYTSQRGGPLSAFYMQNADGTGEPERLIRTDPVNGQMNATLTPDGKTLLFHEQNAETGYDIFRAPLDGDRRAEPIIRTNFHDTNARVSPNSLWLAYDSNASGTYEVYVRTYPDVERGRWQVSTGGGEEPVWSRDGRELFYRAADGGLMSVSVASGSTWSNGKAVQVVRPGYYEGDNGNGTSRNGLINPTYDIARDGRVLVIKEQGAQATPSIVVVQNWFEELKRLVPVK